MVEKESKEKNIPLGQLLLQHEKITEYQLRIALDEQKKTGNRLGHTLIALDFITAEDLIKVLEEQFGIPAIRINLEMLNHKVVKTIPEYICRKFRLIPILLHNDTLTIAATNPYDLSFKDEIKFTTDFSTEIVLSLESSVLEAINYSYGKKDINWISKEEEFDQGELKAKISAGKILDTVFKNAVSRRVQEIQFEFIEDSFNILYIVPNSTLTSESYPGFYYKAISLRIKGMANLDPSKKSFQEGMLTVEIANKNYTLRAIIFPNPAGENISLHFP